MRNRSRLFIVLGLAAIVAVYFIGRLFGRREMTANITNNVAIIKQISELGALQVQGSSTITASNKEGGDNMYAQLKNLLTEKTINMTVPYTAKYGVRLNEQDIKIDTKANTVDVYLPPVELLSMQLDLANTSGVDKVGWLYSLSLDDFMKVQKRLYADTEKQLKGNPGYTKLAQNHISEILQRYYDPLNLKLTVHFKDAPASALD